ncbi:proton-conducting transporter membrane subunit [Streptomyces phaeochromogenes]|uniref:proton-conducting transporter transmembrane domain-containing protein n=1 Tax=Streptomyces phaeochromogenes TaxID=1923 RepID=UPI002DDC8290|nr:proton-conducting transporter membrane subunit [Streptomyces phaeochromogenes]WRZ28818.1 proton-conducting transporter membrane subunit [Streptomyces phaeochromogenes]
MTPATTALLLTAPAAVPLAVSAAYALTAFVRHELPRARVVEQQRLAEKAVAVGGAPGPSYAGTAADAGEPVVESLAPRRPIADWAGLASPAVILGCAALLAAQRVDGGSVAAYSGLLRADALTAWMLLVVGAVAFIACASAPAHLAGERAAGSATAWTVWRYHVLVQAFLGSMCLAVVSANLGVLWVAIEATTVVTAFLVGHRRTRTSVEAAWKYVVICSAGIALAFLGTVLLYYAARQAGVAEAWALDWPTLVARADRLDPAVTRLGISLVVLGYGAKAGLVPLHAWLPDAHSQAPAPVSALMSGVLLSVAFAAILRYRVIADAALGPDFTRVLLAGIALLTLTLATGLLLAQRDYKRMLAYSSMEHMSLIALAAAIGSPLALAAGLLHIAGHGLAKATAFCASGQILHLRGTSKIGRMRGLLAQSPWLGALFGLAVAGLLGFPPFSLFASELGIARAGFAAGAGLGWATAAALLLVLVAFAALAIRAARMLLGPAPNGDTAIVESPSALWPLTVGLAACAALGVATGPLGNLLTQAAAVLERP